MRRLALCLVAGALVLAGCGGGAEDDAAPTTTVAPPQVTAAPSSTTTTVAAEVASGTPPGPPAPSVPPTSVLATPPVDLCTEALTVAGDVELTFDEAAARLDALAARAGDPGLAAALADIAASFRAGNGEPSLDALHTYCG
jgi:hypothetical protein